MKGIQKEVTEFFRASIYVAAFFVTGCMILGSGIAAGRFMFCALSGMCE